MTEPFIFAGLVGGQRGDTRTVEQVELEREERNERRLRRNKNRGKLSLLLRDIKRRIEDQQKRD